MTGRVGYTVLFLVFSALTWIARAWADDILRWIPSTSSSDDTFGILSAYRVTFALAMFHTVHMVLLIGVRQMSDIRAGLQNGLWNAKILFIVGLLVAAFSVPDDFFAYFYAWAALVGSALFVLVQLVILVDFAHFWAERWVCNYEQAADADEESRWWWALLSAIVALYLLSLAGTVVMYVFFTRPADQCTLPSVLITLNLLLAVLVSLLAVHPSVQDASPRSGLLQAGVIVFYCTYLTFSSQTSLPESYGEARCNQWTSTDPTSLLVGTVIVTVSVVYSTIRAAHKIGRRPDDTNSVPYNFSLFHLFFLLGTLYIAMLMTGWSTISTGTLAVNYGMGAVWTKAVASWACYLIYTWTLVAPICITDREWDRA